MTSSKPFKLTLQSYVKRMKKINFYKKISLFRHANNSFNSHFHNVSERSMTITDWRLIYTKELTITVISLIVTFLLFAGTIYWYGSVIPGNDKMLTTQFVVLMILLSGILLGSIVYQITRTGNLKRHKDVMLPASETLYEIYGSVDTPSLCVLIPSYKEELHVLKQTILSAVLTEYPKRRVVILIDDPPDCQGKDLENLIETRAMIQSINVMLQKQSDQINEKLDQILLKHEDTARTVEAIAVIYEEVADWIIGLVDEYRNSESTFSHIDRFFVTKIIEEPAFLHRKRAASLRSNTLNHKDISLEIQRLRCILAVEVTSFERKQYVNLSHQLSKAMNLSSYIQLLGGCYKVTKSKDGLSMIQLCCIDEADLCIPAADYLLTLDADSLVTFDYALKLMPILDMNPHIAVAQTPYSAFPGAPELIERTAGATTDIQYFQHQGYAQWNATFWVGANAVLRVKALYDIRYEIEERGYRVSVFIQERTVIEDTGSTIDLINKNWTLYNHPERLSYSATPPDFGSLIIQRRRWANGGLIIFPILISNIFKRKSRRILLAEFMIRSSYLLSLTITYMSLLLLVLLPFNSILNTNPLVMFVAIPYFYIYGRDLRLAGYRWIDLPRVYSLNLLLLPVVLAGVFASLKQIITGKKTAFRRTPKIEKRTRTPLSYIFLQWLIFSYLLIFTVIDIATGQYIHAFFCGFNLIFQTYGLIVLIPIPDSLSDLNYYLGGSR